MGSPQMYARRGPGASGGGGGQPPLPTWAQPPAPAPYGGGASVSSKFASGRSPMPSTPLPQFGADRDGFVANIMAAQHRALPAASDKYAWSDPSIGGDTDYDGFTASIAANVQWRRRYGPGVPDFIAQPNGENGGFNAEQPPPPPPPLTQVLSSAFASTPEILDMRLTEIGQVQRQMHSILARKSVYEEQLMNEAALSASLIADAARAAAENFALAAEYVSIECTAQMARVVALDLGKTSADMESSIPFSTSNPVHKLATEATWLAAPRPMSAGEFEVGELVLCALDWNANVKRYARVVRVNQGGAPSVVLMTDAVFHSIGASSREPIGQLVRHVPASGTFKIPSRRQVRIPASTFIRAFEWLPTAVMLRNRHLATWFDVALRSVENVVLEPRATLDALPRQLPRGPREGGELGFLEQSLAVAAPRVGVDVYPGRTDLMVAQMVRALPNARRWNLRGATRVTNVAVGVLASLGRQIVELNFADCPLLADRTFISLASCFSALERLDLSGCHKMIGSCLPALARATRKLTTLKLAGCSELDDTLVSKAVDLCASTLTDVDFSDCHRLKMGTATALARCVHLKHLRLDGCWEMEDSSVKRILDTRTSLDGFTIRLRTLSLSGVVVSEGTLKSGVRGQVLLRSLSLGECPALNNGVLQSILDSTPELRDLNISNSDWVDDSTLYMLARYASPVVEVSERECVCVCVCVCV